MKSINFFVFGTPVPKGSMRAFQHPHFHRPVIIHDSKRSKPWADTIAFTARAIASTQGWLAKDGTAYSVSLAFHLPRPRKQYRGGKLSHLLRDDAAQHHVTKPDLDKLTRLALDALTGIIWHDDNQVTQLNATKFYATEGCGLSITITEESHESVPTLAL